MNYILWEAIGELDGSCWLIKGKVIRGPDTWQTKSILLGDEAIMPPWCSAVTLGCPGHLGRRHRIYAKFCDDTQGQPAASGL